MKVFQKQYSKDWEQNSRLLFGVDDNNRNSPHRVAYGWGLMQNLITEVYVQNPDVIVDSRSRSLDAVAKRLTQISKWDVEDMRLKDIGNLGIIDIGVAGLFASIETIETASRAVRYTDTDTGEERDGVAVDSQEFMAKRIAPKDFFPDPRGLRLDLTDHRYVAVRFYPTIGDIKDDPILKWPKEESVDEWMEASEKDAESKAKMEVPISAEGSGGGLERDSRYKPIAVFEVHDRVSKKIFYLTDHKKLMLGSIPWPVDLTIKGRRYYPITVLAFHPVPHRFYPMPEVELIAPQLREINAIDLLMHKDTVQKWRKWVTIGGLLQQEQKAMIADTSLDNAIIEVDRTAIEELVGGPQNGQQIDLRQVLVQLEDISLKRDLPARYEILEGQIQHILGYGAASGMAANVRTRSAREAMVRQDAAQRRLVSRMDRIAEFYRLWHMKHLRFLQQKTLVERWAKLIPDIAGIKGWFSYNADDIKGDFDFTVYAGTSAAKSSEAKRATELQLFQAVAPIVQATGGDMRVPFSRLARYYDWDGTDEIFNDQKEHAKKLAMALYAFSKGKATPEEVLNLSSTLVGSVLSPQELKVLLESVQPPPGRAQGSAPQGAPPADNTRELAAQGKI